MIFYHKPFALAAPESRSFEWAPNTENQAANQRSVADSDPEIRLNRLSNHSDSLANEFVLAMIENNLL